MDRSFGTLLVVAVLVPGVCAAQQQGTAGPFSYTYVEIGYAETDFEVAGGGELDGDGFTLSGSFEMNDEWHAFAGFGNSDLQFGIDLDTWFIGAGYRYPLQDDLDIYGRLMYLDVEADIPGPGDPDEDGLGLQVRLRYRVNEDFEVEAGIQHTDVSESDTSLQAEGRYYFQDNFSVGVGIQFAGDSDGIGVNARLAF